MLFEIKQKFTINDIIKIEIPTRLYFMRGVKKSILYFNEFLPVVHFSFTYGVLSLVHNNLKQG